MLRVRERCRYSGNSHVCLQEGDLVSIGLVFAAPARCALEYTPVAAIGQPKVPGSRVDRIVYERLLLPWKTPSGEIFVTMASRMVDAIAGSEPA